MQSIRLSAAISCEIKGIGEPQILASGYCDEIVNNALLEIATDQSSYLRVLKALTRMTALQSKAYELASMMMNIAITKAEECNSEDAQFSENILELQIPRFARDDNNSIQTLFPRILRLQLGVGGFGSGG